MDKQAILDQVVKAFLVDTQEFGIDPESKECLYRTPGGDGKCAIGVLLPDEICTEDFLERFNEGSGVATLLKESQPVADLFGVTAAEVDAFFRAIGVDKEREASPNVAFLARLQACHDHAATEALEAGFDEEGQYLDDPQIGRDVFEDTLQEKLEALAVDFGLVVNLAQK